MRRWLALIAGLAACEYSPAPVIPSDGPPIDRDGPPPPDDMMQMGRVTNGLIGFWGFNEGAGTTVTDTAMVAPAINSTIANAGAVTWTQGALVINSPVDINSGFTGDNRLLVTCKASNAVTLEAWVEPANDTQTGTVLAQPARIVTFGPANGGNHDIGLGQLGNMWAGQVRTSDLAVDKDGGPVLLGSVVGTTTHLVVTADATSRKLYVNGQLAMADSHGGTFMPWDKVHATSFAGDPGKNQWLGTLLLVAMYDRALTDEEVMMNFVAGP